MKWTKEAADHQREYRETKRRETRREKGELHPKEEGELRARARTNITDDLNMLRAVAFRRTAHANKRIQFLGECELTLVDQLRETLERL